MREESQACTFTIVCDDCTRGESAMETQADLSGTFVHGTHPLGTLSRKKLSALEIAKQFSTSTDSVYYLLELA